MEKTKLYQVRWGFDRLKEYLTASEKMAIELKEEFAVSNAMEIMHCLHLADVLVKDKTNYGIVIFDANCFIEKSINDKIIKKGGKK